MIQLINYANIFVDLYLLEIMCIYCEYILEVEWAYRNNKVEVSSPIKNARTILIITQD